MSSKDDIKDIFSSKLQDFEPELPVDLWKSIEAKLPQVEKKKNSIRPIIIRWTGVAACVAAMITGMLVFVLDENMGESIRPVSYSSIPVSLLEEKSEKETEKLLTDNVVLKNTASLSVQGKNLKTYNIEPKENEIVEVLHTTLTVEETSHKAINKSVIENSSTTSAEEEIRIEDNRDLYDKITEFERAGQEIDFFAVNYPKRNKSQTFTLGAGGGAGLITAEKNMQMGQLKNSSVNNNPPSSDMLEMGNDKENNNYNSSPLDLTPAELDHKQPISFGITVNKNLNDRVGIETGVMYTYLYSKVKSEFRSAYQAYESQSFHYIGIPVYLNYTFATFDKAQFYMSVGGKAEKDIHGWQKAKENKNHLAGTSDYSFTSNRTIHQKNIQFSTMATVGAMYPIYDKLYLYATFGGAYYFDANNKYATIYSEKRFQMDVNIGVKFDLK